jgi:hypothetical protein
MSLLSDAKMYARFAWKFPWFLKQRVTPDQARVVIAGRMREREDNFLRMVRRAIYGYPGSPYLPLLEQAGCELGDLERMVATDGLQDTLRSLREAGVYVSFEEFKGRQPIERNGVAIEVGRTTFDNPFHKSAWEAESGGTTGAGTRVAHDLEDIVSRCNGTVLARQAHGVLNVPTAVWRGVLPNATGIGTILSSTVTGRVPDRWFSPTSSEDRRTPLKFRVANTYIVEFARLNGVPFPRPEHVPLAHADVVARWISEALKRHPVCHVNTSGGMAVRISQAAQQEGLDLTGAAITMGGEPPTEAKVQAVRKSGARHITHYHCSGVGAIGYFCTNPVDTNDQHFVAAHLAMIQYPRTVPGTDIEVSAFNLTSLMPSAPKVLLNVEIDDYGTVEERRCGCPFEELGFTTHIRDIRSFRKLTGEGITLIGSDMEHILDTVLPERFGGAVTDYQLWEEEDEQGLTRLSLVVSPRIRLDDEKAVIDAVMKSLSGMNSGAEGARAIWAQADSFRVKRAEPFWTSRGKLMPLHLVKQAKERGAWNLADGE